jgi:leader peptidase (prepilin peptidase)/N-methyltransferase
MPAILIGGFGLLIGSFLNVVVYRLPLKRSLASPPSACGACGARIRSRDNVPVLSWLVLRGRCRDCDVRISARYPLVELGTAVFFGLVAWWAWPDLPPVGIGASSATVASALVLSAFLYLAAVSIALALIDLDTHRLPNPLVLPGYVVGAALLGTAGILAGDYAALVRGGLGLVILGVAYLVMALAYPGGMGMGDVKLAGVLGLFLGFLGWGELVVGAFAAFLLGGLYALGLLVTRRATRKSGIPFGPWMLAGAWVGIFWGAQLWDGYLSLVGIVQ